MNSVDQVSTAISSALGAKPLWAKEIGGEVSYRIERFVCRAKNVSPHPLEQPVLITHFGGKKVLSYDSDKEVTSFPSVATFVPAGIRTNWCIQSSLDFAAVYLRGDTLDKLLHSGTHITDPVALTSPLCCSLTKEIAELLGGVVKPNQEGVVDDLHIQALSGALIWQLCYELNKPPEQRATQSFGGQFNYVQEALNYINANLGAPLHAEDIAAQVGLHQSHFRKVFLQVCGTTLHRYVLELRLDQARELLTTSGLSLVQISEQVGFSSQSHMATTFRKHFDVTPAEFRRLKRR